jgi:rfaE bifunctional protein kinase chain/domain
VGGPADREDSSDVSGTEEESIARGLRAAVADSDVLVVSDYGKGVVTGGVLPEAIALARRGGKIICVDPKESHFGSYVGVTALTPNQTEAGNAVGRRIRDDATLEEVGWELSRRLDAECVVITRGELGMSLFLRGGELIHLPTVAREVYDVTGAGDTVVSVIGVALAAGATMVEAALIANHAAGIVIREIGTASVTPDEIESSLAESEEEDGRG